MSKKLCSIIVPVYNVEKYLEQCLTSIIQSTGEESEIILVMGNSLDSSNAICKKYSQAYSNIVLLQQDGIGLSNARNCGLRIAKGTYVSFIDSDDYVAVKEYSAVINFLKTEHIEQFDVLLTDYVKVFYDGLVLETEEILKKNEFPCIATVDELDAFLSKRNCFWNVWRYIYRKDFLLEHDIWFLENRTAEDVDFTNRVFINQSKLLFWHNPYYFYRKNREDSLMNNVTEKRIKDITFVLEKSIKDASVSTCIFKENLVHQYQIEYLLNIVLLAEIKSNSYKKYYGNWKDVFANCHGFCLKSGVLCINFLGLNITARMLYIIKKIRRLKINLKMNFLNNF